MRKDSIASIGKLIGYKDLDIPVVDEVTSASYVVENNNVTEKKTIERIKKGVHLMVPIRLDISTADIYMLNSVDIRIRFELAPSSLLLSAHAGEQFKYQLNSVKLWGNKIIPHGSALLTLNRSLFKY